MRVYWLAASQHLLPCPALAPTWERRTLFFSHWLLSGSPPFLGISQVSHSRFFNGAPRVKPSVSLTSRKCDA